jgi:hypothetical protein
MSDYLSLDRVDARLNEVFAGFFLELNLQLVGHVFFRGKTRVLKCAHILAGGKKRKNKKSQSWKPKYFFHFTPP